MPNRPKQLGRLQRAKPECAPRVSDEYQFRLLGHRRRSDMGSRSGNRCYKTSVEVEGNPSHPRRCDTQHYPLIAVQADRCRCRHRPRARGGAAWSAVRGPTCSRRWFAITIRTARSKICALISPISFAACPARVDHGGPERRSAFTDIVRVVTDLERRLIPTLPAGSRNARQPRKARTQLSLR